MRTTIIISILLCSMTLLAQNPVSFSLEEILSRAVETSAAAKKARIDREGLRWKRKEARADVLPKINVYAQGEVYPAFTQPEVPGSVLGLSFFGPLATNPLGQPWQMSGAVTFEQLLFDPSFIGSSDLVRLSEQVNDLFVQRTEEDVMFTAALTYYQTLQMMQMLGAIDANWNKVNELYRMVELQVENNYAVPLDLKRIGVARNNLAVQRANLQGGIASLQAALGMLTGMRDGQIIIPIPENTSPGADSSQWLALMPASSSESRLLERQLDLNRVQMRKIRNAQRPRVSAFAALVGQIFRPDRTLFETSRGYNGLAVAGVRFHAPLFDGFRGKAKFSLLQLEGRKIEEDRVQLNAVQALEFRQAQEQMRSALRQLKLLSENIDLANEVAEKTALQYSERLLGLADVLNAQTARAEAEANYWQQAYAYRISVLKLLKAAGRLNMLSPGFTKD